MVEVVLEKLPPGVSEATIQAWHFEEGDAVTKGDELVELSTEEGMVTLAAPGSGILAEVYYDEGEIVEQGEVLCLIETEGEAGLSGKDDSEEGEE